LLRLHPRPSGQLAAGNALSRNSAFLLKLSSKSLLPPLGFKNMRQSCFAVLLSAIASLTIGCHQAPNGSSPLAPVGTISNQMTPARSVSTGIGPFGGRTRIAPPGTGSYAVPNNYMGGAPTGDLGVNAAPTDSFDRASGVRPAAFAETATNNNTGTFGAGFNHQSPANTNAAPGMSPQFGGMRVHDLTNAPAPPGYHPHGITANQGSFQSQPAFTPQPPPSQQFFNGNAPVTNQFPANNFQPNPTQLNSTQPSHSQPQIPNNLPGAQFAGSPSGVGQPSFSIARSPGNDTREVPLRSSPMQPSFRGAAQFPSTAPSTDPVSNNATGPSPDLPWRRPTSAY
jgi:hypothetical protein